MRSVLRRPGVNHLDGWLDALDRGWQPSTTDPRVAEKQRAQIKADPTEYLASQHMPEPGGRMIELPDGTEVPRLPMMRKVIWDGSFCGLADLRWQEGTGDLPETCLGHIGYSVVEWKWGLGLATQAVRELAEDARILGLPYIDASTLPDNLASRRVMEKAGAQMVGSQGPLAAYGDQTYELWRIEL